MKSKNEIVGQSHTERAFIEYAWNGFDALHVLNMLLSSDAQFYGQNQILFAALRAWIVAPKDDKLRKSSIIKAVGQKIVNIETEGYSKFGNCLVVADVTARLTKPEIASFYEQIYYPIGGLKTIIGPLSHPDFLKYYRSGTGKVDTALEIASIYHYHSANLSSRERYRQASLNIAAPLITKLENQNQREGGDAVDNIKKQWRASRPSISLAYAASMMRFQKGSGYSDLLHAMQSGDRALKTPAAVLPRLIGIARYVEETILSKTYKNDGVPIDFSSFGIAPINMKGFAFSESDREKIASAFALFGKGRVGSTT